MIIERLQDLIPALVAVVHLDLLVLVADQLLHIDAALPSDPEHDSALVLELRVGKLRLFDLELVVELGLLLAHVVLGGDGGSELLELGIRGYGILNDILLEISARLWLLSDRYGLVDHLEGLRQSRNRIGRKVRGHIWTKLGALLHE